MIVVKGDNSHKIYAVGTPEECFQQLQNKFPSRITTKKKGVGTHLETLNPSIYPEPLRVFKVRDYKK
ncbi:hypothetical protein HFX84_002627 [Enterococcus faecalis]|uniref:hypothetical protein n=1 Tax=Enterococcus faecalis TaxID=1351 RepID=UPI0019EEB621|nr:hypothetical protein [Enterococcus faecalis]EGO5803277.1 hypothetical protein [Enterococcus faecalis]EGO5824720.1 hypothetical protein [Enterococcus faecalis]EGO6056651.1 hypothetical protein [Enterococcus faecalis]EGO6512158.1 hypothetical protein [Enterococcus faecalis]